MQAVAVLAAAAFQEEFDLNLVAFTLLKMNDGSFDAEVISAVISCDGIHRVWSQLSKARRLGGGIPNAFRNLDLTDTHRRVNKERRHARILADGTLLLLRHI